MIQTSQVHTVSVPAPILNTYFPERPTTIKTRNFGNEAAEVLMFKDPRIIFRMAETENKDLCPDQLRRHLRWIIAKSQLRTPQMTCPFCKRERVSKTIAIRNRGSEYMKGFFFDSRIVSCKNCVGRLATERAFWYFKQCRDQEEIPLKFSEIAKLPLDTEKLQEFLMKVFDVKDMTPQTVFEFFNR